MVSTFLLGAIGLLTVTGLLASGVGVARLRKWWTMRRLDPSGPPSAGEGLQEFRGRAHAVEKTITAPLTGTESLICKHRVERRSGGKGSEWHTVEKDDRRVPFEIDHSGSTIAVDPENAQELLTEELSVDLGKTDEIPGGVRRYLEQELDYDEDASVGVGPIELNTSQRYRFTEERLDDGEEVYVLGTTRRDPSAIPEASTATMAITRSHHGWKDPLVNDPLVISDTGEGKAERRQLKSGLIVLLFGLVFTASGIGIALFTFAG